MKATNNYSLRDNLKFGVTAAAKALPNTPVLLRNQPYRQLFAQAKELGYDELELHLRVPEDGGITELIALEEEFGLGISAVATGQSRGLDHLCLIDPSPEIRRKAVERMKQFIDWASAVSCRGVILGNIRGNLPLGDQQRQESWQWLRSAMEELLPYAERAKTAIFLEVINRYENNYLTTAQEANEFAASFQSGYLKTHLDTFHMNIEESDMLRAIRESEKTLGYIHFADNTRHACGDGALDFRAILGALQDIHYSGYATVECLPIPDGPAAAEASLRRIKELLA